MSSSTGTETTTDTVAPSSADFPEMAQRYRRELLAHCYRARNSRSWPDPTSR